MTSLFRIVPLTIFLWFFAQPVLAAAPRTAAEALTGYWTGKGTFGPNEMTLIIKITKSDDGLLDGVIFAPDSSGREVPMASILYNDPDIRFEPTGMETPLTGKINSDATEITGTVMAGPKPVRITFKRSLEAPKALVKPELNYEQQPGVVDINGYWTGELEVPGMTLSMAIKVGRTKTGEYGGELDVVEQGARGIPINSVTRTDTGVEMRWKAFGASFKGALNPDGTELTGAWAQGGREFPLKLKRARGPLILDLLADKELSFTPLADKADTAGFWQGTLKLPNMALRLLLKIGRKQDGGYRASLDSVDQGMRDMPVTTIGFTNQLLRLELRGIRGLYVGTLTNNNQKLTGTWEQGEMKAELDFERAPQPEAAK